jgi:hypothetical protein
MVLEPSPFDHSFTSDFERRPAAGSDEKPQTGGNWEWEWGRRSGRRGRELVSWELGVRGVTKTAQ